MRNCHAIRRAYCLPKFHTNPQRVSYVCVLSRRNASSGARKAIFKAIDRMADSLGTRLPEGNVVEADYPSGIGRTDGGKGRATLYRIQRYFERPTFFTFTLPSLFFRRACQLCTYVLTYVRTTRTDSDRLERGTRYRDI